jgi:hypothetical protein
MGRDRARRLRVPAPFGRDLIQFSGRGRRRRRAPALADNTTVRSRPLPPLWQFRLAASRPAVIGAASANFSALGWRVQERAFAVEDASQPRAGQGRDDEEPELRDRPRVRVHSDQRRPDRARRIDRRAGDVDADQMDHDQRQADCQAAETFGASGWVTPRIVTRNRNVPTTSNTNAEAVLYSPR